MADLAVSVTVLEVSKRDKPAGGYKPAMKFDKATEKYVPDYSVRGHNEPDERQIKSRMYVHAKDWSVLENLIDRESRPVELYRKALPEVFAQLGIEPIKASWSQKAGCSCPCSPGFVLDARLGYDVYVVIDVVGANALVDPKKVDRAAQRFEAVMADPTLAPFVGGAE